MFAWFTIASIVYLNIHQAYGVVHYKFFSGKYRWTFRPWVTSHESTLLIENQRTLQNFGHLILIELIKFCCRLKKSINFVNNPIKFSSNATSNTAGIIRLSSCKPHHTDTILGSNICSILVTTSQTLPIMDLSPSIDNPTITDLRSGNKASKNFQNQVWHIRTNMVFEHMQCNQMIFAYVILLKESNKQIKIWSAMMRWAIKCNWDCPDFFHDFRQLLQTCSHTNLNVIYIVTS